MAGNNNYIEEFFIAIGFDTKRVKKEAKEVDNILQGLTKRTQSRAKKSHDVEMRRAGLKRQAVKRSAQEEADLAKKGLDQRLKLYKKEKREKEALLRRQNNLELDRQFMKGSANYRIAKDKGLSSDFDARLDAAKSTRDFKALRQEMNGVARATNRMNRNMMGLGVVQKGLNDSTRNMIRSYVSLFALFEGTAAIKRIGQDFQGMEASMLAASGGKDAAAKDMVFINKIVDEMGLSLKDTTDAFVKFKFSAKGKMADSEMKELFEGVSMFGTALKVAPEDMKRAQRAISQMASKGVVMAEEFNL